MKQTPHDLLLARHADAAQDLDTLRCTAIDDAIPIPTRQLLHAFFYPQRRLWLGLAAAWAVILAFNFSQPSTPRPDDKTIEYTTRLHAANQAQLYALLSQTNPYR